ncbi:ATP-binding cassette domain-containing protein [Nonomuraea sp. NPDC050547]|uniref:ABC transporter ATP-binding protein n=1 Tax=unclassified Nonomuraea TaxID=2593643 RepID=UPI00379DA215
MIKVVDLRKVFRRPRAFSGPFGSLRALTTRQYVEKVAVDGVSFEVGEGEVVGYIGPNGAGKSTTIKMLTGILVPTGGTVQVAGRVPWKERKANARSIGVVFGQRTQLWWDLPLIDSLRAVGALYDVPSSRFERAMRRMRDLLALDDFLDTPVRQLSLGQRMRGDLTAAMLYEPPLLYLDEPTVGLDVFAKEAIRGFIKEINETGRTTVILTTHDLSDVAALCRRIILINCGKVLYDGGLDKLVRMYAPPRRLVVQLVGGPGELHGVRRDVNGRYVLAIGGSLPELVARISAEHAISDLTIEEPTLEDVIKEIY